MTRAWTYAALAARLVLCAIFLVAAAGKLMDPVKFLGGISEYGILKGWALALAAAGMPGVEIVAAVGLLIPSMVRPSALLLGGMLLMFMAAMGSAMARGLELDCSCFDLLGAGKAMVGWGTQFRDLAILIPALWLTFRK